MDILMSKFSEKRALIGASILRIGFGLLITYFYAIHYSQRHFLWGYSGIAETQFSEQIKDFSLYQISSNPLFFEVVFHLGMIVALLFTLGYKTKIMTILNVIFIFSIHQENGTILDGGDNIMFIILIYMIFVKSNMYFSLDKYLSESKIPVNGKNGIYFSIVHNFGILAIIIQLCMMYLNSSLYKVMGEVWQNGTAIFYILQVKEFNLPWITNIINSSGVLVTFITYFTIFIQIMFPFALLNKKAKYFALFFIIPMHLGIGFIMGIVTFSLTMIVIDAVLISDEDYKKAYVFFRERIISKKNRVLTDSVGEKVPVMTERE